MTLSRFTLPPTTTRTMFWALLIVYAGLLVGRSMYQNFSMNREIDSHKKQITKLETIKRENELALVYYRSSAFREIEARRRLNLKGPDEHVVVLTKRSDQQVPAIHGSSSLRPETVPLKPWQTWWQLIFESKKTT